MNPYSYRVLTKQDAEKFRQLRREVVAESPIGLATTLEEESQRPIEFFQRELSFEEPSRVFAAFFEEKIIATAGIRWPTKNPSGQHMTILYGVQTSPEFRRQSLSRHLVTQAIIHAFSLDCLRIYLYVYLPNVAVSLYESLGFTISGIEPEALKINENYHDLQFMSLRNPGVPRPSVVLPNMRLKADGFAAA
jgi:RimJ/RimL family protein N-acetyltransferase